MSLRLPDSMPWQIYQAYLQGPSALLRLFEDAFGQQALYGSPDPDLSSTPSTPSPSRSGSSRRRSGGCKLRLVICAGTTSNSSAGTRNWRRSW